MRLANRINPEIERKMLDAVFVGKLAALDEIAGTFIDEPVKYLGDYQDHIQFYIKCISEMPEDIKKHFSYPNNIFTGNTKSRENRRIFNEMIGFDRLHHFEAKDKVTELLENKIILFKLDPKPEFLYVDIIKIEEKGHGDRPYSLIPSPELKPGETAADLEQKLAAKGTPFILKKYPHLFRLPDLIYYGHALYGVSLHATPNPTTYSQREGGQVKYLPMPDFPDWVSSRLDQHLYIVDEEHLEQLREKMETEGILLADKLMQDSLPAEDKPQEQIESAMHIYRKQNKGQGEELFLSKLKEKAQKEYRIFYKDLDLYSFHISAKTNLLTVIGGMSGTGKSQLARIYGESLGLEYGKDMLLIPVSPSYQEPNDVLGYLNPSTGIYHESETGLVSLLLEAESNKDRLYMVIFDEMNLSQVEHWFSPFISLLELDKRHRYLQLFNGNSSHHADSKYKPRVKIGDNIIFVGTANFDETTKSFSDRLLDRTNIINPAKMSFRESVSLYQTYQELQPVEPDTVPAAVYREQWVLDKEKIGLHLLSGEEIYVLDGLHDLLHENDIQKGVSFRVALGIAEFISNIPYKGADDMFISRGQAFDLQVKQRILTKVKGMEAYAEPLIGSYGTAGYQAGRIAELLKSDQAAKVSDFRLSLDMLKSKAKELMLYGYTN
ncbi:MAG: McrB family protein [Bacillus sp. (in: firmicutes)]